MRLLRLADPLIGILPEPVASAARRLKVHRKPAPEFDKIGLDLASFSGTPRVRSMGQAGLSLDFLQPPACLSPGLGFHASAQHLAGMHLPLRAGESGGRRYLKIVESCSNEAGKPGHRVVASLGRLDDKDGSQLDALIRGLCHAAGREEPARVLITHEPVRACGDVLALHESWKDLGLDRALGRALRSDKRKLDVEASPLSPGPMAQPCRLHTVHPGNVAERKPSHRTRFPRPNPAPSGKDR